MRHKWLPVAALAAIVLSHPIAAAPTKEVRRILILNEVGTSYPGINIINQGIQSALTDSAYRIEFYSESLDTILFPDPAAQQELRDFYIRKYQNRKPDVIITVGPSPLKFMKEDHQKAFPGVPIVFCVPNGSVPGTPALDSDFTGIENDMAPAKTLEIALALQPGTEHVVVVGGVSDFDKQEQAGVKQQLKGFTNHLDVTYMTDLAVPDLLEHLRHLPSHTVVLFTTVSQDAAGTRFKSSEIDPMIATAANAPVFALFDVDLNHGEVGGYLSSLSEQGKVAGTTALRTLRGQKPQDIPWVKAVNTYMFDWRALKRWGLKESALPPGSILLNRQFTIWEAYRWYIIGGISLIVLEALLIFALAWQRARAKRAETQLAITFDRLRLAVEAGKSVGWDWDIKSGRDRWFGDLETVFGIPSDNHFGHVDDFRRKVHPDDREPVWQALAGARQNRQQYVAEFRVVRTDGTVRWITARGKFYYAHNGDPERMLGMAVDITDRKQAEQKLSESENRLAGIVGSAMDAIIAVDEERRIVLFNAAAEKMFGCRQDEAVGTVIDRFIPERFRPEHETSMRRFGESGATTRNMGTPAALWAVRTNGQEFPMEASITHLESNGGKLFTVIIRDITDRRLAEESLATIGRRLIEAHEEERTRIGRELHDDINQRLALLAVELDRLNQHPPSAELLSEQIRHAQERINQIARDVQGLSHRLHSSKLEYLGLASAANSFCKELSEQTKVEIQFNHSGIPRALSKELSLCLFRVLQEALQNAVKYSGVRSFTVDLHSTEESIELRVADNGSGFEEQEAFTRHGLGLISMRERLQLVHGELSVKSKPGAGTTIRARVPFKTNVHRAMAG